MTTLQVRIDENLRTKANYIASEIGIDLPTAVRMFLKEFVKVGGLPFSARIDPFYLPENQEALKTSIRQLQNDQTLTKTLDELEAL